MAWRNSYRPRLATSRPALERGAWLSSIELYQAENAHQVAELTVMHTYNPSMPSQQWRTPAGSVWAENTPVHLRFGWWADDSADWYGYVASSRVLASESDPRYGYAVQIPVVYTLTGTSMLMQTRRNRTWRDTSPSAVARTVGTEYNLQPRVDGSSVRLGQQMQSMSDWQFLCDVSDQIGYRVYVDGTQLWFVDRETVMPAADGSVPVFRMTKSPGAQDTLREFSAVLGDTDPAGGVRARYQAVAYNRTSSVLTPASYSQSRTTLHGRQVSAVLERQYDGRPTASYTQAGRLLAAESDWLWVEARAVTNGDPRLRPGSLVELRGDAIGESNLGLWMVRSAVHKIGVNLLYPQKTTYTTTLVLGRNDARKLDLKVQHPPVSAAPTELVNGRWRAAYTGGLS
ncbi:contractile injection system protein, VgrG/Pvc8 family [Streptomyces sp. NPDC005499]|uniref:contractile injection system protein, VgrG/Pvc8 family n=1 Tax=Streptomyces sp. NPDC005499 TaxID=3154883 RepID=UPI0033A4A0E6